MRGGGARKRFLLPTPPLHRLFFLSRSVIQFVVNLTAVRFKMVSMRSGKPIIRLCAPLRLSDVCLMSPLKRFQCIIGGSCHKYNFCHDKCFVASNTCLSRQMFGRDKNILSRQKFSCGKHTFVAKNDVSLVAANTGPECPVPIPFGSRRV